MAAPLSVLDELLLRLPVLAPCRQEIERAGETLIRCFRHGGKVLVCGNGGSAADADHIVAELMKDFRRKRPLPEALRRSLAAQEEPAGLRLAAMLQVGLSAINLSAQSALCTAIINDMEAVLVFAQQVLGYGKRGDVLIGLSTSGEAEDVCYAVWLAKAMGLSTIVLTGRSGGKLKEIGDVVIRVPAASTPEIQELHQAIYHALCGMVEEALFAEGDSA